MPAHFTQEIMRAHDGAEIELLAWVPEAPAHACVQIAHGMGEHAGRYDRFARALAERGYAVYANNHRGHGKAALAPATRGDLAAGGFPALVQDMATVTQWIRARNPSLPVLLLGHSMGSFAAQIYALDHSHLIDGLALSGTAATDLRPAARGANRRLEDLNAAVQSPRTPFDWLSRDAAEVDKYIADPLCGFALVPASIKSMNEACSRTSQPGAFGALRPSLPVYLFTGDQDPVNQNLQSFHPLVQRIKEAGLQNVTSKVYRGARHEVLNETNRDEVTTDFLSWADSSVTKRC
jgi:alpha-beta hydrolase superfamily lysophospholipase